MPSAVFADFWTWENAGKFGKKVVKKIVLPATVVIGGAADAATEYSKGGDTIDVLDAGVSGAGARIGDAAKETFEDMRTIGSAAADAASDWE
jgi:hypothetical protein